MTPPRTLPPSRHRVSFAEALAGSIVGGKYRILRALGRGGMGTVYKAENVAIGKMVALKLLHLNLADDDVVTQRFEREARITVSIGHPNIVEVLDMGREPNGAPFIVMEYVRGKSLNKLLQAQGPMSVERAVGIVGQVLEALSATHARGVVHRDLKPENVLVRTRGRQPDCVKVFDFGISTFVESGRRLERQQELTPTGFTMTTPYYASPEQIAGGKGRDPRVDIYAVGVMLYELLSGHRPYQADNLPELCEQIVLGRPAPLRVFRKDVPSALCNAIEGAMHVDPESRFQSAEELLWRLLPFGAKPPPELEPEPTDTFTLDLRELGLIGPKRSPGPAPAVRDELLASSLVRDVFEYFLARHGEASVRGALREVDSSESLTRAVFEAQAQPVPAALAYGAAEALDRRFGKGDRAELADIGRHLARRLAQDGSAVDAATTPELFFSSLPHALPGLFGSRELRVVKLGRGYGRLEVLTGAPLPLAASVIMLGLLEGGLRLAGANAVSVRLSATLMAGDDRDAFEAAWGE